MSTAVVEQATLNFGSESVWALNFTLGFLLFAVSLFIEGKDFYSLKERPRALVAGLTMQWLMLPLLSLALIWIIQPHPGLALGMLLVCACPGGNASNFLNLLARANVALSIGLTSISTLASAFMTPFLFFASARFVEGAQDLPALNINFGEMVLQVFLLVAIPLALGQALKHFAPDFTLKIRKSMRTLAGLVLLGLIMGAFLNNLDAFKQHISTVIWIIVLHNTLCLLVAYAVASAFRLPEADRRAITIESGVHNSGLGLVLIFTFFGGSGPMALIAAGWSVWHLISGGALALWWSKRPPAGTS